MKHATWLFLVCVPLAGAQTLSFGVKGGGFFTDPAEGSDQGRKYVVGPAVEIGIGARAGLEVNALYSRFGTAVAGRVRGHSVEFPVLGKFYFADRSTPVRPWASSGFAFRNIWFDEGRSGRGTGNRLINSTEPAVGAVVAGGVAFRMGFLRLAPEIRYTRWGGYNYPATNPNQVQALVGITF